MAGSLAWAAAEVVAVDATLEGALAERLLLASNDARTQAGLPPLVVDDRLALAATRHAWEMAELDYFAHVSPVAANAHLAQRVRAAGSPLVEVGENLARIGSAPYSSAAAARYAADAGGVAFGSAIAPRAADDLATAAAGAVVRGWLDSPGHRRNLLEPSFGRVGFGFAYDATLGLLVVQVLAWEPAVLEELRVAPVAETRLRWVVRLEATRAADVILSWDGAPAVPLRLSAGVHDVDVDPHADDTVLAIGVRAADGRYLVDEAAILDARAVTATAGAPSELAAAAPDTFRPDPSAPRAVVRLLAAFGRVDARTGVDLHAAYRVTGALPLVLLVDDVAQQENADAPGVFDAFVPLADDATAVTVSVGIDQGDGRVRLFHRFVVALASAGAGAASSWPADATAAAPPDRRTR